MVFFGMKFNERTHLSNSAALLNVGVMAVRCFLSTDLDSNAETVMTSTFVRRVSRPENTTPGTHLAESMNQVWWNGSVLNEVIVDVTVLGTPASMGRPARCAR